MSQRRNPERISGETQAEAKEMSIFEYNQERHMMQEREAAWNEADRRVSGKASEKLS